MCCGGQAGLVVPRRHEGGSAAVVTIEDNEPRETVVDTALARGILCLSHPRRPGTVRLKSRPAGVGHMDHRRAAPLAGIAGCLVVLTALVYPYLAVDTVGTYYGTGVVNPLVGAMLALVAVIVFAAGREERSDPQFAAGAALVFSAFAFVLLLGWALTVRLDAVELSGLHRWVTAALALVAPAAALWYARALSLL
ncbi:MAG: hypothetical protein ACI9HI_000330 [Salinirussus sp.]